MRMQILGGRGGGVKEMYYRICSSRESKTKKEQGEQKTFIVHCEATFLVHSMTAQITTVITHAALKAEINCEKTLGWFSSVLKLN